jgi:2'-5' RNA ligase
MRVFVGLSIPMMGVSQYRLLEKHLKDNFRINKITAYFKEEDQFHLTLQFLGDITEAQANKVDFLQAVARNFEKPDLYVAGMGAFPSMEKGNKLWLGIRKDPKLEKLFVDVKENLKIRGFTADRRPFIPHVTVANLVTPMNVFPILGSVQQMFSLFDFQAEHINVYHSEPGPKGSTYKILQSVPLVSAKSIKFV